MNSVYAARPAWVEINLDHIVHNISQFQGPDGRGPQIMAVVKADGYGHGAVMIARTALEAGATSLAVAFVEEGIHLRRNGLDAPILLLGYTDPDQFTALIDYKLTPTLFSYRTAEQFSAAAVSQGCRLPVHLKVDTGMGRVGLLPADAVEVITAISKLPGLDLEGLFTHLADAEDEDHGYTLKQLTLFEGITGKLAAGNIKFKQIHAANSAASIGHPRSHYTLLRLGLAMYGYYPSPAMEKSPVDLRPALTFKSRVVLVKKMPPHSSISYGCTYHTTGEELIATVPVGYADGYSRLLSNKGSVLVRGSKAPVVGRICMDHLMIDVTNIPGVQLNDEVVIYGRQGEAEIKIEDAAALIGTVNYELLCAVDKRVSRFYYRHKKLAAIHDFIEDFTF